MGVIQSYYLVPKSTISTIEEIFNLNYDSIVNLINRVLQTHESLRFQFQVEVSLSKPGLQNTTQVYLNSEFFILFNIRMLDVILFTQVNQIIIRLKNFHVGSNWFLTSYDRLILNTPKLKYCLIYI